MRFSVFAPLFAALVLTACDQAPPPEAKAKAPPFVRTVTVTAANKGEIGLSGTVRARVETPLAFQVGGRIIRRLVDAGEQVKAGQLLFEIDPHDLEQGVRAAQADLAAAETALATAHADLSRTEQLQARNFTSAQALERFELSRREAETRREAAAARLVQARNALSYARLQAPAAGVLIDVVAEPGQVVAVGQQIGLLAQAGERELEVNFAGRTSPPARGELIRDDGSRLELELRETAGAIEPQGRTLRARYTVHGAAGELVLGAVLRARFADSAEPGSEFVVPLAAVNERGAGAQVWRLRGGSDGSGGSGGEGSVEAVAVTVHGSDGESARVSGPLQSGDRVVALGTHLLSEGMAVRELVR
ncbi:MAG: efflux RND transporter periplasmic adaptor subunit [Thauera sp.]|jgi:RND family efflux transporter MFP subunit|nr:efflux RND transporter periplasmic adaptor subunit [Thauera sp.]